MSVEREMIALRTALDAFVARVREADRVRNVLQIEVELARNQFLTAMRRLSEMDAYVGAASAVLDTVIGGIERRMQAEGVDPEAFGLGFESHPQWSGPRELSDRRSFERVDGLSDGIGNDLRPFDWSDYRIDMDRPYAIEQRPDVDEIVRRIEAGAAASFEKLKIGISADLKRD